MDEVNVEGIRIRRPLWLTLYMIVELLVAYPIQPCCFGIGACFGHEWNWRERHFVLIDPLWVKRSVFECLAFFERIEFRSWWFVFAENDVVRSACFFQRIGQEANFFLSFDLKRLIRIDCVIYSIYCYILQNSLGKKLISFDRLKLALDGCFSSVNESQLACCEFYGWFFAGSLGCSSIGSKLLLDDNFSFG